VRRLLRWLGLALGAACVVIGLLHFALGISSVPGEVTAGATVDSRERFYNAIFVGYGFAWIWVARRRPMSMMLTRWLAGIFLLGGAGRLLSLAVWGRPHWFQLALTGVELALPVLLLWLSTGQTDRYADHDTNRATG